MCFEHKTHTVKVVPGNHYFLVAETPEDHEMWSKFFHANTFTYTKKMEQETIGYIYYSKCPDRISEYVENWCNLNTIEVTQAVSDGAEVVKMIYDRPGM